MKFSFLARSLQMSATANAASHDSGKGAPRFRTTLLGVLAVLGSAAPALAQDLASVKPTQADACTLWLTIENPAQQLMQLEVVHLDNNLTLSRVSNRQTTYGSKLNFRDLPVGHYAVLVRVGREKYRYTVQVKPLPQFSIMSGPGLNQPSADAVVKPVGL